ncbi:MAG: hypothetical protein ACLUB2_00060 [Butyricicoccus pullicaecorum]
MHVWLTAVLRRLCAGILALLRGRTTVPFSMACGGQRTPTAQWTATAAGAAVLTRDRTR